MGMLESGYDRVGNNIYYFCLEYQTMTDRDKDEMRWWHWVLFAVILSPLAWIVFQLQIQFVKWAAKQ